MRSFSLALVLCLFMGWLLCASPALADSFAFAPQIETADGLVFRVDGSVRYDEIIAALGEPDEVLTGVIQGELAPGEPDGNVYDTRIMYLNQYGWSEGRLYFKDGALLRADGAVWWGDGTGVKERFTVSGVSAAVRYQDFWDMQEGAHFEDRNLAVELYYLNDGGTPVFIEATGQGKTYQGTPPWTETIYSEDDLAPWRTNGLWRLYFKEEYLLVYLPPQD